jgi:hypothetical protein
MSGPAKASSVGRKLISWLFDRATELPTRVYVGASLSALLVGIGVNALILQRQRHPAPLFSTSPPDGSPTSSTTGPQLAPLPKDLTHRSLAPASASGTIRANATTDVGPRASDQIGELLRGETPGEDRRLVLAAQNALIKLGYAVAADGSDGAGTHQALRDFERMHGWPLLDEISPRLVKQLTAAARSAGR